MFSIKKLAVVCLCTGALFSCSDDPVSHTHEHEEAAGFVVRNSDSTEFLRYFEGAFTSSSDTLTLTATPDEEWFLWFIGEDGDLFVVHDDEGFEPEFLLHDNGASVEIEHAHEEGDPHELAIDATETVVTEGHVLINHGGHADFESAEFIVRIEP